MKSAMTKIASAVVMTGFSVLAHAAGGVGTVTEISFTGGDFSMNAPGVGACGAGGPYGAFQCIPAGATIDTDDNAFEGSPIVAFNFYNAPMTTFTAATAPGAAGSTSGNPIEGTATASTISLDFGSFYGNWSGTNFRQAPSHAGPGSSASNWNAIDDNPVVTGTYDSTTGAFDISWSAFVTTAPFPGSTGYWHLTGIATAVPEASTYAMMLAGLGLVGGMTARRRSQDKA
jgi:hypothetical protein